MIVYHIPKNIEVLLFDIDMTLYRNEKYYESQISNQIEILSQERNLKPSQLEEQIQNYQMNFAMENEGKKPSFGNTLLHGFSVPIEKSVQLRDQAIVPENFLSRDPQLVRTLEVLKKKYCLWALTNNTSNIGKRTLQILGVDLFFQGVVGLDLTLHSKPHPEVYTYLLKTLKVSPEKILSIGDRFPVDLEVPLKLGMGAILVENMKDVYSLESFLSRDN